ncbi:MAG: DNA translocase FtsK [Rikenellaceae bacterium]|nr:DNA translocase FtsK [Rikenellaceae bacterium]MBP3612549.1 DNA translocase FtsK [Rikenellaceae bacterium]MBP3682575.1 DNA translocase FtsK [Rikenellaceae bacterium]
MPSNKNNTPKTGSTSNKKGGQTMRWTVGLIMLFAGIYLLLAILFYLLNWKVDCSALADYARFKGNEDRLAMITFENLCGRNGAAIANLLIGKTFGLFGVVIPFLLMILALRITRLRTLHFNRMMSIGVLILLLGTLTLGFIFKEDWGVFGSGLGGRWGIDAAAIITQSIGPIGTILVILVGWILTGVYINRSFINKVNKAGEVIADGGLKVGKAAIGLVAKGVEKTHKTSTEPAKSEEADQEVKPTATPTEVATQATPSEAIPQPIPTEIDSDPDEDEGVEMVTIAPKAQASDELKSTDTAEIDDQQNDDDLTITTVVRNDDSNDQAPIAPTEEVENIPEESPNEDSSDTDEGLKIVVVEHQDKELDDSEIDLKEYDPAKDLPKYQRPPVTLLEDHSMDVEVSNEEIYENKEQIKTTLQNFGIAISKIKATVGPTVTLYEIIPAPGIKIARIKSLEEDIAMSLKALRIRIIAPIPGKGTVGIEVPNKDRDVVSMLSAVKSARFQQSKFELPVVLGRTIQNENFVIDLAKMPHLLVAGATGQGKSVGLNAIITSLLYKKHPSELKFVMIDPKRVELSLYAPLEKHFLAKMESEDDAILTDPQKVIYTLNSLVVEMEQRYELLRQASVKKITEYNDKFRNRRLNPQKGHRFMPYLVVVVDEFADLIMTAGREIETPIVRLAQMGRAVGLHLIIATQRPEVKVITGLIKSNFPARIAFRVMSMMDSRTIIDTTGANQLIGCGDMLMSLNSELTRVQCAFVDTPEIENIISFISRQQGYTAPYALPDYVPENSEAPSAMSGEAVRFDPKLAEIARWFVQNGGQASTSSIQRNFEVGFNRAGRIMNQLERAGIVGRQEGSKPRDLKVTDTYALERILQDLGLS